MQDSDQISQSIAETDSQVGTIIDGRFEILSKLGRGAFASVYKARHLQLDKFFAVKIMHTRPADGSSQLARFLGEAAALQKLKHRNIVGVSTSGVLEDGRSYIILEYVESQSLRSYVDKCGPLSWDVAKPLFMQILDGLAHAHAEKIIHRDLKPDNILVAESPELMPKIVDFGIAKWIDPDSVSQKLTKTGTLLGTPLYMSPEQAGSGSLTDATDIYSTGCVLYYCLTGHPPFEADNPFETLMCHQNETLPVVPTVGADVNHVLSTAMAKLPEARYASALEFKEALEGCDAHSAKFATGTRKRRRKVSLPLTALWFVAAVIFSAGAFYLYSSISNSAHADSLKTLESLCDQGMEDLRQAKFRSGLDAFHQAFALADSQRLVLPPKAMVCLQKACEMLNHDVHRDVLTSIPWMQELMPLAVKQFSKSPAYYQLAQKFADKNSELAGSLSAARTKSRLDAALPPETAPCPEFEAVATTNHQLIEALVLNINSKDGVYYDRNNPMLLYRAEDFAYKSALRYLRFAELEVDPERKQAYLAKSKAMFDDCMTALSLKTTKDSSDDFYKSGLRDGLLKLDAQSK